MNMTRKNLMDLAAGDTFVLTADQGANYVCTGKGTIGNLTRVSYILANDDTPREWTFTKVNLTSVYVFN